MGKTDWIAVVVAGFVAGTLDVVAAALINLVSPVRILHFIAGGLLGRQALAGGARSRYFAADARTPRRRD